MGSDARGMGVDAGGMGSGAGAMGSGAGATGADAGATQPDAGGTGSDARGMFLANGFADPAARLAAADPAAARRADPGVLASLPTSTDAGVIHDPVRV